MECQIIFQNLVQIIVATSASPEIIAPYTTTLTSSAIGFNRMLESLVERYTSLYNFHQPSSMAFHCMTHLAFSFLENGDRSMDLSTRQAFRTFYNAIQDMTETLFLANSVLAALEIAAQKRFGVMWAPLKGSFSSTRDRKTRLSEVIERMYSAYPSDLSNPDFDAARADFVLKSLAEVSLGRVSPAEAPDDTASGSTMTGGTSDLH